MRKETGLQPSSLLPNWKSGPAAPHGQGDQLGIPVFDPDVPLLLTPPGCLLFLLLADRCKNRDGYKYP